MSSPFVCHLSFCMTTKKQKEKTVMNKGIHYAYNDIKKMVYGDALVSINQNNDYSSVLQ